MYRVVLAAVLLSASARATPAPSAPVPYGILLMAHGGDPSWNAEVDGLRGRVDAKVPTEIALGMADHASLQAAVDRLEKRGVARIVAVPLFVQSRSEVLDQTRWVLGLANEPSAVLKSAYERIGREHAARAKAHAGHAGHVAHADHGAAAGHGAGHGHSMAFSEARVASKAPIAMTAALDDAPLVAAILLERAKALSKNAARETVVLVAHGPVDDAAAPAWTASLSSLCAGIVRKFRGCAFGLLRDDAAPEIRAAAVAELRAKVALAGKEKGRAIVVPVLIARGGIERKVARDLAGLEFAWDGRTLMPHGGFDAWVLEAAEKAGRTAH